MLITTLSIAHSNLLAYILCTLSISSGTSQLQDSIPVHETFAIASEKVSEVRTINVWTPPEYAASSDSLPVLYMPDGGVAEDFPHIANTIASLVAAKKIPPIILVGIENTQRRRDLTGPTEVEKDKEIAPVVGGSAAFRDFIGSELIPEINKRYKTTHEKGIMGESLAGLFVTETLMLFPGMFDFYIAFDPSLWWNDNYLVKNAEKLLSSFPETQKRYWFACSGTKSISKNVKRFEKILEAEKIKNLTWKFSNEPKEKHSTIFRATKEKALIWTLNAR